MLLCGRLTTTPPSRLSKARKATRAAPAGYKESYMLRHPRALLPEKFQAAEAAWANRHVSDCAAPVQQLDYNGVHLSNDAFGTLLHHHALVNHQLGKMVLSRVQVPPVTQPHAVAHFGGTRPHPKAEFFRRIKARFAPKGWHHRSVAKSIGKGKAAAVKVDTVAVAGPSGTTDVAREKTPVVEDTQTTVAPEDIFMADYTLVKDEEDTVAGGLCVAGGELRLEGSGGALGAIQPQQSFGLDDVNVDYYYVDGVRLKRELSDVSFNPALQWFARSALHRVMAAQFRKTSRFVGFTTFPGVRIGRDPALNDGEPLPLWASGNHVENGGRVRR
ncbi:hypothetical protein B0H13DRAFT_1900301 [Mycena leptocephala]|nr:hypothetical protein B0H13DRAFT_1900301 [Mycena leptocephala]